MINTDFVFAVYQDIERPNYLWLYNDLLKSFQMTIDRIGKDAREDGNERRRQITLHSFRRFVKTTISDLGYADYSEYYRTRRFYILAQKGFGKKLRYSVKLNLIYIP